MFDLEKSIAEWRQQMLAAGIKAPVPLDELESHLREEIEWQMKLEISEQTGFQMAMLKIGEAKQIRTEFRKMEMENGNHPFAWTAWLLFVTSFFLPAYSAFGNVVPGWQCAWFSALAWRGGLGFDVLATIHFTLLTPANLLMLSMPFLLWRFSSPRLWKCLHFANVAALMLVWSFVFRYFANGEWRNLNIGCYLWAVSFLLLCLSSIKTGRRAEYAIKS